MNNQKLNSIITKASYSKLDSDYNIFFNEVKGCELFFNLIQESVTDDPNADLVVPLVSVGDNLHAVVFYTSNSNKHLKGRYGGIDWIRGLEMVFEMPRANGLIVQNEADDWIAISDEKIRELYSKAVA